MFFHERPIEPARFVVLAIGVVVAGLRTADLIAHSNHRYAEREHGKRQEIPDLPVSQFLYAGIVRSTLDTAVPASIVIGAITIALAIGLIVFLVIRDEVVERQAVVA